MRVSQKLKHELSSLAFCMLYFTPCLAALVLIKTLLLAEYLIDFNGWSQGIFAVLVLSKVVLIPLPEASISQASSEE